MALSEWDDYFIHQINRTVDTVASDSPHAMDRLWFSTYEPIGAFQLMGGLCVYPTTRLMDGFLLVRKGDTQRNIRFNRHAVEGRFDMKIGPLSYEVVKPQQTWRVKLDPNEWGLEADFTFEGRSPSYLFERANPLDTPTTGFSHYRQYGSATGSITFDGERIEIEGSPSVRDRSWGVRDPRIVAQMDLLLLLEGHFDGFAATLNFRRQEGAFLYDDGSVLRINSIKERAVFDEETRQIERVDFLMQDENGEEHIASARMISPPCYYTGGGYDGRHGQDLGEYHEEGETWDLSAGQGFGGVFPYYARVADMTIDGIAGDGHLEAYVSQDPAWTYRPTWVQA